MTMRTPLLDSPPRTGRLSIENSNLRVTVRLAPRRGVPSVRVLDKRTDLELSAPLCGVSCMWEVLQRPESAEVELLGIREVNEWRMDLFFRVGRPSVFWTISLELEEADLIVTVPWASVEERRSAQFRLIGIHPLPGLLKTRDTLVAPLKGGALIRPGTNRAPSRDSVRIYGSQPRWEDLPLLPVCGLIEGKRAAVAAIVEDGECDAQYELDLPGDGSGSGDFSFCYRYQWPDPVDPIDRKVRFCFLIEEFASYAGIGRRLNAHMREVQGVSTLAEKISVAPFIGDVAGSMVMKTFHGIKDLDRELGDGCFHLHQTFGEAAEQLAKIRAAGVEKAYVQIVGWTQDGHDGIFPERFPVDGRIGGEEGLRRLIRFGQGLGYQMQVHDNFVDSYVRDHPGVLWRMWGEPIGRGIWGGGSCYIIDPRKTGLARIQREMERVKDLGVQGIYYLDAMAAPLEIDYDRRGFRPRRAHSDGMIALLKLARSVFGAVGTETGFAHVARHVDYVTSAPFRMHANRYFLSTPAIAAVDEWIPLWQIAFHGLLIHAQIDRHIPSREALLEAAEIGAIPRSDFSGANPSAGPLLAVQWSDDLLPMFRAKYEILCKRLGGNRVAFIHDHECLGNRAYRTRFSNGCSVTVDYAEAKLWVDEHEVSIPPVFDLPLDLLPN